jgi:hypothetical protein
LGGERPRRRRAAEQRNEVAAFHLITMSSAGVFAVLRLIDISLFGCFVFVT